MGLKKRNFNRIRYMPVLDKRIYNASREKKLKVYREIGKVVGDYTEFGLVFFELDIGITRFGSNFSAMEQEKLEANSIEHDLQAAAKDFWTPGNVGIYRHYLNSYFRKKFNTCSQQQKKNSDERSKISLDF